MMKIRDDIAAAAVLFCVVCIFAVIITTCAIQSSHAGDPARIPIPIQKSSSPITVITPTGLPTFVYPSQSPTGPAVVVPPNSLPVHVYPPTSSYGPTTILTPDSGPTYAWPGAQ